MFTEKFYIKLIHLIDQREKIRLVEESNIL